MEGEVDEETAFHLDYESIISLCELGFTHICRDKNFWVRKVEYELEKHSSYLDELNNSGNDFIVMGAHLFTRDELNELATPTGLLIDSINKKRYNYILPLYNNYEINYNVEFYWHLDSESLKSKKVFNLLRDKTNPELFLRFLMLNGYVEDVQKILKESKPYVDVHLASISPPQIAFVAAPYVKYDTEFFEEDMIMGFSDLNVESVCVLCEYNSDFAKEMLERLIEDWPYNGGDESLLSKIRQLVECIPRNESNEDLIDELTRLVPHRSRRT